MPAKRISTMKIQDIYCLLEYGEIMYRKAAKSLGISRGTLKKYVSDIRKYRILYPENSNDIKSYITWLDATNAMLHNDPYLFNLFPEIFQKITKNGSTRKIEWAKYKSNSTNARNESNVFAEEYFSYAKQAQF